MSPTKMTILALVFLGALAGVGGTARADADRASCDFLEISATNSKDGGIADELKPLQKKLKKPPFSSWNTFTLLQPPIQGVELTLRQTATVPLKNGTAGVVLREIERPDQKKPRVVLGVTLDDADRKRVVDTKFAVDAGDFIVVGRSLPNNDGHLLAIYCRL